MTRSPKDSPEARLLAGLVALKLAPTLAVPLLRYLGELVIWNKVYNLTAVREPAEMVTRHLLDSLTMLPHVSGRVADVGTGAGLPGLPLAIANPALRVTLMDGNGKKARFLRNVQRVMALPNVEVAEARAEKYAVAQPFDCIVCRAFGPLEEFLESTEHFGTPVSRWLAMKGKIDAKELGDLPKGFRVEHQLALHVPGLGEERHLLVIRRDLATLSPG